MQRGAIALGGALAAITGVVAFHAIGRQHDGFAIRYVGTTFIDQRELVFLGYYALLGSAAMIAAAAAIYRGSGAVLQRLADGVLERPSRLVPVVAVVAVGASLALRHLLLQAQPIADDELTYRFIAKTLLEGRVVNPLPLPREFLENQFAVINERGWFGKYPIGHPLLLAAGMAFGIETLIVPLLAGAGVLLTFGVGRELFGERRAALGALLLLFSPQYLATHATQMSQTSSMVCMLLGMLALLRLRGGGALGWALLGGCALGFGVLVRPLPGLLFVGVAGLSYLLDRPRPPLVGALHVRARELLLAGAAMALFAALLLHINELQAGAPTRTAYHEYHAGGLGVGGITVAGRLSSLADALLRQSFWLIGWPLAMLLVLFARPRRGAWLLWGMIAAEYTYRLIVPKTVVATTGPIYVMEAVPLFALAVADGMARWAQRLEARDWRHPRGALAALGLAGALVALACFVPVQAQAIARGGQERAQVFERLERSARADPLVVFAFDNLLVFPGRRLTWAYYAPYPSPDLHDHTLFLRAPPDDRGFVRVRRLWRERFADRRAFILLPSPRGPVLRELANP